MRIGTRIARLQKAPRRGDSRGYRPAANRCERLEDRAMLAAEAIGSTIEPLENNIPGITVEPDTLIVPQLSSNPGADKTIYLDFNGHFTTQSYWQTAEFGDFGGIASPAYDSDGDDSAFSETELLEIQEIWLRMAEDFAPFDVNVTTIDPGSAALTRTSLADQVYGVRVVFGGSQFDWYYAEPEYLEFDGSTPLDVVLPEPEGDEEPEFPLEEDQIEEVLGFTAISASTQDTFSRVMNERGVNNDTPVFVFTDAREPQTVLGDVLDEEGEPTGEMQIESLQFLPAFRNSDMGQIPREFFTGQAAAAIGSREVGHSLGLGADGVEPNPNWDPANPDENLPGPVTYYYPAAPDPETGLQVDEENGDTELIVAEAPIMGDGRNAKTTRWSMGNYAQANNTEEDDLFKIANENGFGYREDDAADYEFNFATGEYNFDEAVPLQRTSGPLGDPFFPGAFLQDGIIERSGDSDLYRFTAAQGTFNIVVLPGAVGPLVGDPDTFVLPDSLPESVGPNLNVDFSLYNEQGDIVAFGSTLSDDGFSFGKGISVDVVVGGDYYLVVEGFGYGNNGQYQIRIDGEVLPAADRWDQEASNDFPSSPTVLSSADYFLPLANIHLPGDEDHYAWTAGEDGLLSVSIDFTHAYGDLDLRLLRPNGQQLAVSASGNDNEAILNYPVTEGETYLIKVAGVGAAINYQYDLTIDGPGYPVDEYDVFGTSEDVYLSFGAYAGAGAGPENYRGGLNDSPSTPARFVPPGLSAGDFVANDLSIHVPGDIDYYLWQSQGTGTMTVDLSFLHDEVDIDLEVLDANTMQVLGSVDTATDNEHLEVEVVGGQEVLIRVSGEMSGQTPGDGAYSLSIEGPDINEDQYENNDTFDEAYRRLLADEPAATPSLDLADHLPLNGFLNAPLTLHNTEDVDYFFYTPEKTGDLRVRTFFLHDLGDLDMRLTRLASVEEVTVQDPDGDYQEFVPTLEFIAASTSRNDSETITQRVYKGETYVVEIYGFQQATLPSYLFDALFAPVSVAGDYDGNGFAGPEDLELWKSFYGADTTTTPEAAAVDGNGDGVINSADYIVWRNLRGNGAEPEIGGGSIVDPIAPPASAQSVALAAATAPSVEEPLQEESDPLVPVAYSATTASEEAPEPFAAVTVGDYTDRSLLLIEDAFVADDADAIEFAVDGEEESLDDAFAELASAFGSAF